MVKGVGPGQLYGYKGRGPYQPEWGLRFNEAKLLLAYDFRPRAGELVPDTRDNTGIVPKAIVIDDNAFDWQGDSPPDLGLEDLIIHKVHVKVSRRTPPPACDRPARIWGSSRKSRICSGSASTPFSCCPYTSSTWTTS